MSSYGATEGAGDDFFKPDDDENIEEGGDDIGLVEKPEPSVAHAGVSIPPTQLTPSPSPYTHHTCGGGETYPPRTYSHAAGASRK